MSAKAKARRAVLRLLPTGGVGAEIGVWRGDFSARILEAAQPTRLYLIDPWRNADDPSLAGARWGAGGADTEALYVEVRARFAAEIAEGRVTLLRQRSANALAAMPDDHLDFAYIDGDHRRDAVLSDLRLANAKLKPGGLLALDDHRAGGWWEGGVIEAVAAFRAERGEALALRLAEADQIVLEKRAG